VDWGKNTLGGDGAPGGLKEKALRNRVAPHPSGAGAAPGRAVVSGFWGVLAAKGAQRFYGARVWREYFWQKGGGFFCPPGVCFWPQLGQLPGTAFCFCAENGKLDFFYAVDKVRPSDDGGPHRVLGGVQRCSRGGPGG